MQKVTWSVCQYKIVSMVTCPYLSGETHVMWWTWSILFTLNEWMIVGGDTCFGVHAFSFCSLFSLFWFIISEFSTSTHFTSWSAKKILNDALQVFL